MRPQVYIRMHACPHTGSNMKILSWLAKKKLFQLSDVRKYTETTVISYMYSTHAPSREPRKLLPDFNRNLKNLTVWQRSRYNGINHERLPGFKPFTLSPNSFIYKISNIYSTALWERTWCKIHHMHHIQTDNNIQILTFTNEKPT